MFKYLFLALILLQIVACKSPTESSSNDVVHPAGQPGDTLTNDHFFPVTNYIKGQINDIRLKGVNPMMYVIQNQRRDSSWLKSEDLEKEMSAFLDIDIDSTNLKNLFAEKKFLDQTLNAYTFTYDPLASLPDSIRLQHWDIYVDPETNKIKRIYIIAKDTLDKQQQLTWQSDKWSKIITLGKDKEGNSIVEKEVLIKWDF